MKHPYKVMWILEDEIIYESQWIMAETEEKAKFIAMRETVTTWSEEVRVLCTTF